MIVNNKQVNKIKAVENSKVYNWNDVVKGYESKDVHEDITEDSSVVTTTYSYISDERLINNTKNYVLLNDDDTEIVIEKPKEETDLDKLLKKVQELDKRIETLEEAIYKLYKSKSYWWTFPETTVKY